MRFIVTGAPRSATRYTAKLLCALGIHCEHETAIRPVTQVLDLLRWWHDGKSGESSWMAWTALPFFPKPMPVIHVVRNPWYVLDSLCNRNAIFKPNVVTNVLQAIRDIIEFYCPDVFEHEKQIDRAASFIVKWNQLIRTHTLGIADPYFVFHADRVSPIEIELLLAYLAPKLMHDSKRIAEAIKSVRTDVNAGYSVDELPGISDPNIAEWVRQYAAEKRIHSVIARKILNHPVRTSAQELAEAMSPEVLAAFNAHAQEYRYPRIEVNEPVAMAGNGSPVGCEAQIS